MVDGVADDGADDVADDEAFNSLDNWAKLDVEKRNSVCLSANDSILIIIGAILFTFRYVWIDNPMNYYSTTFNNLLKLK